MNINIEVNGKMITAKKGETILSAINRKGISVPTLCYMKDFVPTGACRMCVVEVEGRPNLITACSYPVEEGLRIKTHSPRVVNARKTIIELLLSNHPDDCLYCERNKNCELQTLAEQYNVRERRISGAKNLYKVDQSSASIYRDPAKCILCGRCVRVCEEVEQVTAIDFVGRGNKTIINSAFNKGLNVSSCVNCGQCIMVCPTGALHEIDHVEKVLSAINSNKYVVVQHAPSISVSIAEEFGLKPGTDVAGVMTAALRKIGFKKVFDTSFSADLTIMEESAELIQRIQTGGVLPMFTSCCPAWVKYVEEFRPDMIKNLSSCKSPQQMLGAVIKSYFAEIEGIDRENIYSVSIMPCTAKKFESQREEMTQKGVADIDAVLTTRELVKLIKMYDIDLVNIEPEVTDTPLGTRSSAGKLFGNSGGVMEAALRTAYYKLTGEELKNYKIDEIRGDDKRKELKVSVAGLNLGVAVVSGLTNAEELLKEIEAGRSDIQFIEVMTCPGGCVAGGGQPITFDAKRVKARMKSIYDIDKVDSIKASHQNPEIKEIYEKYFKEPNSEKSHHLLHTHYQKRNVLK
ncbi:MAG: ferredoxin [Bacteroidetes bacterium GWE2_29_8]|nr:MAG: ferredoxin [Bacteroidetes bacterium GWE2_29_8]OFY22335.1 MAG: ferredoxin [Bacteroidetes bacterium GWF2_29_10]